MDIQKFKSLSKKDREKFLSTYEEQKHPHEEAIEKLQIEKHELTSSNSEKIEERNKAKKACSWTAFIIIAAVLAGVGTLMRSLLSILFFVAAVVVILIKLLAVKKNKPILEKLNKELADYDATCAEKDRLISEEKSEITKINNAAYEYTTAHENIEHTVLNQLSDIAYRERYFNTLAVYIGSAYTDSYSEVANESTKDWEHFYSSELGDTAVCIDGVSYTIPMQFDTRNLRRDCILFHLMPGVHTVTIASCPAIDPYSNPPLFTSPAVSPVFTVTIDENTPFVGIGVGISVTMDKGGAHGVNKKFVTNSQTEFLNTFNTKFPYTPAIEDFSSYLNDDENEFVTVERILKDYKLPSPKKLTIFTGSYILYDNKKTLSSNDVKNIPWEEYKSAHVLSCTLKIDGCRYPLNYETSLDMEGGKYPREYYDFTLGAGEHTFSVEASLLMWPKVLIGKEVISDIITTKEQTFTVAHDDDFVGLAVGFATSYETDNRLIGSIINNQGGFKIALNNVYIDNDEGRFMSNVAL